MNPTTYSLCQKPVIGMIMWVTSLCSFPPLFSNEPISLSTAGASVSKTFVAPVERKYSLEVSFVFKSVEAVLNDKIVGERFTDSCDSSMSFGEIPENQRVGLGRTIPFKVLIRKVSDSSVVLEKTFASLCLTSSGDREKTRTIALIQLQPGEYAAEVTNLQAQSDLEKVKTIISLTAGRFPK